MNLAERRMQELLVRGRDDHGVVAVKAEFEAEGTRPDEFLRLLEMAHKTGLKVALKIGGCEAVSDLLASTLYGVDYIIAPMVETPYALSKFIQAKNNSHSRNNSTEFLFNLETETTLQNLPAMAEVAAGSVDGIVFGRVDFILSRGLPRNAVNARPVTDAVLRTAEVCRSRGLQLVVGGSVSNDAIDPLREIRSVRLDRFETRKVVFDGSAIDDPGIERGIANAIDFELLWLENKRDYYQHIGSEDAARIDMMKARAAAQVSRDAAVA